MNTAKRNFLLCLSTLLLIVGVQTPNSHAIDFVWDVNGDGVWQLDGNWDQTGFPDDSLDNASILNTTTATDGVIVTLASSEDVGDINISDSGNAADQNTLFIGNNVLLDVHGDITNNGIISLNSAGNNTRIRLEGSDLTLNGAGVVNLGAGNNGFQNAAGTNTLTNTASHTIAGGGNIGFSSIGINNAGTISANLNAVTMTVDPSTVLGLTNTGTMQATVGGILLLTGSGGGSFTNTGALIEATGAGSEVRLTTNAAIIGGTVRGTGGGLVRVNTSENAFFTDVTFEGAIQSNNNSDFGISGTINNSGTITMASLGNNTDIRLQANSTLTGSGKVVLAATSGNNAGINGLGNAVLTNAATHTVEGQGNIGENTIGIVNQGTINANVATMLLTIDPDAVNNLVNTGTMQATSGGIMVLTGNSGGSFTNTGALIEATGAGSEVRLTTNAAIIGGTVRGTGGGLVRVNGSQNAFFTDVTFEGAIQADNNADFGISGTINNSGTLTMASTGNNTDIELQADTLLTGPGKAVLAATTGNNPGINGIAGNHVLTNAATHTIEGQGNIGENSIGIVNQGLIHANVAGMSLTINPDDETGSGSGLTNTGTMKATSGGIMVLTGNSGGTFTNTGALIEATGAGSEVRLKTNAAIIGGTVRGTGSGLVRLNASENAFFTDVTFEGAIQADNNADFGISGTINNSGTLTMASTGNNTDIELQVDTTLTGAGKVVLQGHANAGINGIAGNAGNAILTNSATHTIEGRGSFGENTIGIVNQGTIDANVNGETLTIDPDVVSNMTNSGTLRASNGGVASLTGNLGGTFTNTGTSEALDGSTLRMESNAVLTNLSAGTLTGGTYRSVDSGNGATMTIVGTAVDTIAAGTTVELSGATATMTFGGTALQDSLMQNDGTLRIFDAHHFSMTNALTNGGTTELGGAGLAGGQLTSGDITNDALAEIFGHGTINNTILNSGTVRAANGTLVIASGIIDGQSGTIQIDAGATLDLSGASGNSDADFLVHNGNGLSLGTNDLLVRMDYTNANFGTGNSFDPRANVTGAGQILADPAATQSISGDVLAGGTAMPSLNLGNIRVGDSVTKSYAVNNGANGPALRGAIQTNNAAGNGGNITDARLSGSGVTAQNFGPVANGSATANLDVTFTGTTAGDLAAGQAIAVVNNFDNVDSQKILVTGTAYNAAVADVTPTTVDFGIVHVGDLIVPEAIQITNDQLVGAFNEDLLADNFAATGDAIIAAGSPTSLTLPASVSDSSLGAQVDTSIAGNKSGTITFDLASTGDVQGTSVAGLAPLSLGSETIQITAQVNEFAAALLSKVSGDGAFSQNSLTDYDLDLGIIAQGSANAIAELSILNDVLAPADDLAGSFVDATPAEISLTGFGSFADLIAGDLLAGLFVELSSATPGTFGGTLTLNPLSENSSGFSGVLPAVTINVSGQVTAVPEPSSIALCLFFTAAGTGLVARRRYL